MATSKWDMANWQQSSTKGVTLLQAFGISKGKVSYPALTAGLPSSVASSQNTGASDSAPVPTAKGDYSQSQLQQLWIAAGGNPSKALIASAIAMAESGGDPNATDNDSNGTIDRGLWQINSVHGAQSTYNPLQNARAAIAISSNGTNWEPWVTYQKGLYEQFM
jgi:hypothetical protein